MVLRELGVQPIVSENARHNARATAPTGTNATRANTTPRPLFVAESGDGIGPRGAPGRQPAREERNCSEK